MSNAERIGPLDGMRTVAIILVLIFHLNEKYLAGGFVGVDIFFVISGYIITRNIVGEIEQQRFSFANFYWRRVTRLLPAAAVTIAASLIAATFIYSPAILREFGETAFFAATWTVNVFFWLHSGYWDDAAQSNIFLHMWSLSVEEQFYLVWPLIVFFLLLRFCKHIGTAFALITIVGAVGAYTAFLHAPTFAFYMMPTRIFQFSAGAAVAMAHMRYPATFTGNRAALNTVFFGLGLAAIGFSAWFADGAAYNVWVAAMLPTAGAAVAIFAMNSGLGRALLAPQPVQYIGRRAYSLYLVHWPIMVMTSVFYGVDKTPAVDAAVLLSCFVLGGLLFRLVEDRFRMQGPVGIVWRQASTLACGVAAIGFAGHFWMLAPILQSGNTEIGHGSYVQVANNLWSERLSLARVSPDRRCVLRSEAPLGDYDKEKCLEIPSGNKILIIGDSLALEAYIMLSQVFDPNRLVLAGSSGCAPMFPQPEDKRRSQGCRDFTDERFDWTDRPDIDAIVVTSNWQWWNARVIASTFDRLARTGKPIIVIGVRPRYSNSIPKLLDSAAWRVARDDLSSYLSFSMNDRAAEIKSTLKRQPSTFYYLPIENYLCPDKYPGIHNDGTLIYLDQIHITGRTAVHLGAQILQKEGSSLRAFVDRRRQAVTSH